MTTQVSGNTEVSLLDVLDRLLDKGVVVGGDMTISVAEVDLIFASLRLVVSSVDKITENNDCSLSGRELPQPSAGYRQYCQNETGRNPGINVPDVSEATPSFFENNNLNTTNNRSSTPALLSPCASIEQNMGVKKIDPDKASNGLAQLVLMVTDLLRKLLEREALRRMERGTLTPLEMERLGKAFLRLEQKMQDIKDIFNLHDEDLNLNLGPLGRLI